MDDKIFKIEKVEELYATYISYANTINAYNLTIEILKSKIQESKEPKEKEQFLNELQVVNEALTIISNLQNRIKEIIKPYLENEELS